MKLFAFNDDKMDSLGADATPSPSGSVASHSADAARQDAERELSVSRQVRRRKSRSDAGNGALDNDALQAKVNAAIGAQLERLHAPEMWEALLCMPADAALTFTGKERWNLADKERKTLGLTGSAAAQTMMITNPRALAFFMLGSAVFAAYVPRCIAQLKEMREEKKPEEKK